MARCISCHLERQLGPLPIQGASSLGEQVCPRCSKELDRSMGVMSIFGIEVLLPTESREASDGPESNEKGQRGAM